MQSAKFYLGVFIAALASFFGWAFYAVYRNVQDYGFGPAAFDYVDARMMDDAGLVRSYIHSVIPGFVSLPFFLGLITDLVDLTFVLMDAVGKRERMSVFGDLFLIANSLGLVPDRFYLGVAQ